MGADITQNTLQVTLDNAGIEKNITNLSYMEKRLLIVVALLQQTKEAQGDWGRTIESVANQMRIMQQQTERLTRALGNVFLPILKTILPYINAFLMVLTELVNWLAVLVGYDPKEFDYFGGDTNENAWDFSDAIGSANENTKKLKLGLRGFDKLNNITTPSSGSSGSGVGGGALDPKILDLFNKETSKYLDNLDKVTMKATKIRDTIMEWLGFTKITNEETGEITWELKEGYSNLKLIGAILTTITGLKLIKGIKGLITGTSSLSKVLGTGGLYKSLKSLIEPIKVLGAKDGLHYIFLNLKGSITKVLPVVGKFAGVIGGIYLAIKGSNGTEKAMNDFSKATDDSNKSLKNYYLSALETVGGLALAGAVLGGIPGALSGAILGGVITITKAIDGYNKGLKDLSETTQENLKDIEPEFEAFSKSITSLSLDPNQVISKETQKSIKKRMETLTKEISKSVEKQKTKTISGINKLIKDGLLSSKEASETIKKTNDYYDKIQKSTELSEKKINLILQKASKENRALKEDELKTIENYYQTLSINTISTITQSETEQSILYEEFAKKKKEISKDTASEMIKDAIKLKNDTIQNANEQYVGILNEAQNLLNIGAINQETYDKIKKDAESTRDDTIKSAEEQYDGIFSEFVKNNKDIAKYIDKDTGGVKSAWSVFWSNFGTTVENAWITIKTKINNGWKSIKNWWNEEALPWLNDNVLKYFTKSYWTGKLENIKSAIKEFKFPKIKFDVTYDTNVGKAKTAIYEALGLDGWPNFNIKTYANGGLPPVGQLFVANESGPELVGQIGGQSFVANQNQMMELLDRKISGSNGGTKVFNIYLDEAHKIGTYTLEQLEEMAISNGEPITIG